MAIKLELENLRDEVAPLYFKYSSQVNPQPAFIEIDEDCTEYYCNLSDENCPVGIGYWRMEGTQK